MSTLKVVDTTPFKLRLVMDVTFNLHGENWVEVQKNLHYRIKDAIDEGLLTGEMDAAVVGVTLNYYPGHQEVASKTHAALADAINSLANHPEANQGNSKVHYALMRLQSAQKGA